MRKKLILGLIACLMMGVAVYAAVTPTTPSAEEYIDNTNNPTNYDFDATTTTADPNINVYLNDVFLSQIACVAGTCSGSLNLFGQLNSFYNVSYADSDLTRVYAAGNITIDTIDPTTTDFGFSANANVVSFVSDCADTNLNASLTDAHFDDGILGWTSFNSGEDIVVTYGATPGSIQFRGICFDKASHTTNSTIQPNMTLPAVPPTLTQIDEETPNHNVSITKEFTLKGVGVPLTASIRLIYDELVELTNVSVNGGPNVSDSVMGTDHILTFTGLTTGVYIVDINARDADLNSVWNNLSMNVLNADGSSNVSIDILDSTAVPVYALTISSTTAVRSSVLPGSYALFKYTLNMTDANFTRAIFSNAGNSPFKNSSLSAFCGEDYDAPNEDMVAVNTSNVLNPVDQFWADAELQKALNCADTSGIEPAVGYDVYVKFPIDATADPGTFGGTLTFGLYDTEIYS